jgi:hypothetical protein
MSAGFHRLGTNVEGKVTGYHHLSLPVGVIIEGMPVLDAPMPASATPNLEATLVAGEIGAPAHLDRSSAKAQGYTGDQCSNCNSMRLKIDGHCLVCEDCGTTTGCS